MGLLLQKAKELTKKPLDKDEIRFKNGNTEDIIELVRYGDSEAAKARFLKEFAPLLKGKTPFETCRNVYNFVRNELKYVADVRGYERVRLPNKAIWDAYRYDNGGDCKTFFVITSDLLRELSIKCKCRFISQNFIKKARHVYAVAILENGQEVPCDAVFHTFNQNPFWVYKWDFDTATLSNSDSVNGLNTEGYKNYTIF